MNKFLRSCAVVFCALVISVACETRALAQDCQQLCQEAKEPGITVGKTAEQEITCCCIQTEDAEPMQSRPLEECPTEHE